MIYLDIRKVFFQQGKIKYVPLGFRRINQTYARIVNDVLHTFEFKRYSSGRECTIEFGVFPLCQVLEYPDIGLNNLCNFEVATYYADWSYDRNSEISMDECIQNICGYIDRYLIPFFDRANCSATALPALIALDEHFHNIRQIWLKQKEKEDLSRPDWRYASLLSPEKFYMALKSGQYNYAKAAAQVLIPTRRPEYKVLYQDLIDQLEAGNIEYVDKILYENEQKSLKNLEKYRLKPITGIDSD